MERHIVPTAKRLPPLRCLAIAVGVSLAFAGTHAVGVSPAHAQERRAEPTELSQRYDAAVRDFVVGFRAGARRAAPGVDVMVDYSGDFVDASKCAAIARRQVARGAGTLFNVAAACGLGTMQVAADSGVWAVGVDSDQSSLGPHVLTSVLKRFDTGFAAVLGQVKDARAVTGRDTVLGLRQGAVGLGPISARVPRPLVANLESVRRDILAGRIRVPSVYAPASR